MLTARSQTVADLQGRGQLGDMALTSCAAAVGLLSILSAYERRFQVRCNGTRQVTGRVAIWIASSPRNRAPSNDLPRKANPR